MELILYSTNDGENVINKDLIEKYRFNIKMKKDTDISTPTIILNDKGIMNFELCNYCFIEEFQRFYFIKSVENINSHVWGLLMECDVLETYKNEILNSDCEISKSLEEGNFFLNRSRTNTIKNIDIYNCDTEINVGKELILTTIGGYKNA